MTIPQFLDRLQPLARPTHDWIVLGDGTICIRDRLNHDPIYVVAQQLDPTFEPEAVEDGDEQARGILGMHGNTFERLVNAVSGECSRKNKLRLQVMRALNMDIPS